MHDVAYSLSEVSLPPVPPLESLALNTPSFTVNVIYFDTPE